MNTRMLRQKEMKITELPIKAVTDFEIDFLPRPLIRNPSRGNKGIR
jgi:hypothetical protein